jgi:hypothetical protein
MNGWDAPQIYTSAVMAGNDSSLETPAKAQEKFLDFLKNFRFENEFIYRYALLL